MQTTIKAICLVVIICLPVFPLTVDFAPIEVGNTWVYKDSAKVHGYPNWIYDYIRMISVSKTMRSSSDTNITIFDVTVRDSGIDSGRVPIATFDTTYSIDSIIKTRDSITFAGKLAGYFYFSKKDTESWDSGIGCCTRNYGRFFAYNNLMAFMQVYINNNPVLGSGIDSSIFLENVGLIFRSFSIASGWHQGGGITRLISFNGKTPEQISQTGVILARKAVSNRMDSPRFQKMVVVHPASYGRLPPTHAIYDILGRRVQSIPSSFAKGIYLLDAKCGR